MSVEGMGRKFSVSFLTLGILGKIRPKIDPIGSIFARFERFTGILRCPGISFKRSHWPFLALFDGAGSRVEGGGAKAALLGERCACFWARGAVDSLPGHSKSKWYKSIPIRSFAKVAGLPAYTRAHACAPRRCTPCLARKVVLK